MQMGDYTFDYILIFLSPSNAEEILGIDLTVNTQYDIIITLFTFCLDCVATTLFNV
jgi:hypothetical protein